MIEVRGDLWKFSPDAYPALKLITTNGEVRKDGAAVMGRGCARQAKDVIPGIEYKLGALLREHGNRVMRLSAMTDGCHLGSFPVKRSWRDYADLALIERSAHQLLEVCNRFGYKQVVLPRPGVGNGGLSYPAVKMVLEEVLDDDRFLIITF